MTDVQAAAQNLLDTWMGGVRGHQLGLTCVTCSRPILGRPIASPQVEAAGSTGILIDMRVTCGARCAQRRAEQVARAEADQEAAAKAERATRAAERVTRRASETAAELRQQADYRETIRDGERAPDPVPLPRAGSAAGGGQLIELDDWRGAMREADQSNGWASPA